MPARHDCGLRSIKNGFRLYRGANVLFTQCANTAYMFYAYKEPKSTVIQNDTPCTGPEASPIKNEI